MPTTHALHISTLLPDRGFLLRVREKQNYNNVVILGLSTPSMTTSIGIIMALKPTWTPGLHGQVSAQVQE